MKFIESEIASLSAGSAIQVSENSSNEMKFFLTLVSLFDPVDVEAEDMRVSLGMALF